MGFTPNFVSDKKTKVKPLKELEMKVNLFTDFGKRTLITLLIACCGIAPVFAQTYQLTGCVQDEESRQPVEIANVLLKHAKDSTYITGMLTDAEGCFAFTQPQGEYLLHITLIGCEDIYLPVHLQENVHTGVLTLRSASTLLDEVAIVAARPIIQRLVDRVVFDPQNTLASAGGNALDLLREVPGMRVSENDISIIGKGGVKVYINDRETKLSGDELIDYLRSYDASQILKVEVITTPPSKYDAAGNAGIINIRLKSRPRDYVGGTVSGSYNKGEKEDYGYGGLSLNISKGRVSSFLNGGGTLGESEFLESNRRYFPSNTWDGRSDYWRKMKNAYAQAGVDIALERDWTMGVQAIYNHNKPRVEVNSITRVYDASTANMDSLLFSDYEESAKFNRINLNFHVDKVWDEKGKKMTWDVDYLKDERTSDAGFDSNSQFPDGAIIPNSGFDYSYGQNRNIDAVSSAIDFTLPFEKFKMTTGAKASFTNTRNRIDYTTSDPSLVQDDFFKYKEQIYALYLDYNRAISDKFSMQLGMRMEHTRTTGISEAEDKTDKNDYTRLFPTAYFLYSPNEKHALNLSFSNRISRPSQNMVNPFPFYQNKYTYARGKEDLKPSYTYNTELGYTLKHNLNASVFYSYSDDVFSQVIGLDPETNVSSFLWDNFMKTHSFGVNNSYTYRQLKWLQAYVQHGVSYNKTTSSAPTTLSESKGWSYYANVRNTLFLNAKKTFMGTLSGYFVSRSYQGVYLMKPSYGINAGLLYRLLDNKLSLSFNANNILVSHMKMETVSNDLKMTVDNQFSFTSFRIGVSYTFGGDIRSKGQRNSNEDIQRRL